MVLKIRIDYRGHFSKQWEEPSPSPRLFQGKIQSVPQAFAFTFETKNFSHIDIGYKADQDAPPQKCYFGIRIIFS